jgi:CheY-like chemotaxis protein
MLSSTRRPAGSAGGSSWPLELVVEALDRAGLRLALVHDHPSLGHAGSAGQKPATTAASASPDPAGPTPRVLLVDDNPAMRRVLRGLLEDAGMQVVAEAADGLEGAAQAERLRPDVVLMDWRMPRLDGIAATARIRQRLPQVQVVMFSSAVGAGQGDLARQVGASAFVAKGAPPEQLCAAVLAAWQPPGPSAT